MNIPTINTTINAGGAKATAKQISYLKRLISLDPQRGSFINLYVNTDLSKLRKREASKAIDFIRNA